MILHAAQDGEEGELPGDGPGGRDPLQDVRRDQGEPHLRPAHPLLQGVLLEASVGHGVGGSGSSSD